MKQKPKSTLLADNTQGLITTKQNKAQALLLQHRIPSRGEGWRRVIGILLNRKVNPANQIIARVGSEESQTAGLKRVPRDTLVTLRSAPVAWGAINRVKQGRKLETNPLQCCPPRTSDVWHWHTPVTQIPWPHDEAVHAPVQSANWIFKWNSSNCSRPPSHQEKTQGWRRQERRL